MTRTIGILSGKGGVGKTTTALNLGVALYQKGKDITIMDCNLTTPHISLYLGVSVTPTTIHSTIEGKNSIINAIYRHESGVKIIPGDISLISLNKINKNKLKTIFHNLQGSSEILLIDIAAGLNEEVKEVIDQLDEILIVTTPDMLAVTDALKTVKIAEEKNVTILGVILNKSSKKKELSNENIEAIIERPIIATIKESKLIEEAKIKKQPTTYSHPNTEESREYGRLAAKILGEPYEEEKSWFRKTCNKFGISW